MWGFLINDLIVGTPIDEVSVKLEFEIKPIIGRYVKEHEIIYNTFYQVFKDFSNKNINIVPASFIVMIAVIIFMFTYGSTYTDEIIWMWVSIAIVVAVTIFNLIKYGLKDGLLASIAELAFSSATALLLLSYLIVRSDNKTKKKRK